MHKRQQNTLFPGSLPEPRMRILEISPYVPGKSEAPAGKTLYKLSSNESPLGASPAAIDAFRKTAESFARYPDGSACLLREEIARTHTIAAEQIVCGAGSDELLNLIAQAYLNPGDEAIHTEHGFLVYPIATRAAGGVPVCVPETRFTADVDAIVEALSEKTRLVFLANPNNPTGTWLSFPEICRLHAGLPENVILVLDAAYAEYVTEKDYDAGITLVREAHNVIMTRTFSKIYGLAGLRLGWCYAPKAICDVLNRIRGPFNVSMPAIAAGIAAMQDQAFIETARAHNAFWLTKLCKALSDIELEVTASIGNFVLIHFPKQPGRTAREAEAYLCARGCILREVAAYGLPNALRMSIGSDEANTAVIEHLSAFMAQPTS